MSYQVLARKWRPRRFQDLVGQEHVLRVLMNALNKGRLHHAYLFAGTRGVGKTTLARIFAKGLNCEAKLGADPCGTCAACRAVDAGQFLDLYEIDAASRTKVEDTRDLLENVAYPPVQGRYKVYLIDEVHMLSTHSFNALLKTLEEPPPQVVFIFATTEPKKLPITILSRCLQFHLKQLSPQQITDQMKRICESEKVSFEEKALAKIARAADGSLRDALSLLDQALAYCEDTLREEEVNGMLGYIAQDEVLRLLQALAAQDAKGLFEVLGVLHRRAPDYQQILAECLSLLHQIALVQQVPGQEVSEAIQALAKSISPEDLQLYYQIALLGQKDLPYAPSPAQGVEMALLRMLAFRPAAEEVVQQRKPVQAQAQPARSVRESVSPRATAPAQPRPSKPQAPVQAPAQAQAPTQAQTATLPSDNWRDMLSKLQLTGLAQALALHCSLAKLSDDVVELQLAETYKPMLNPKLSERIEQALGRYLSKKIQLKINLRGAEGDTPAKQMETEKALRHASALESLQQDRAVQKIKTLFNATLDSSSVEVGEDS